MIVKKLPPSSIKDGALPHLLGAAAVPAGFYQIYHYVHVLYHIQIEISFRIAWRRSFNDNLFCNQSTIDSQALIGTGSLSCTSGCNGTLGNMSFYCTDYSEVEDWTAGGRTYQTTISTPEFEAMLVN